MPKIYQENQVTPLSNSVGSPAAAQSAEALRGYGRQFQVDADKYEQQAQNIYSSAVKIQWQQAANEIASNPAYANNPQAMQAELRKISDKMSSEIVDDNVKVDFLANSIVNGQAYVNKANINFINMKNKQAKSAAFDAVYGGMELAGVNALNILSGGGTEQDIVGYLSNRQNVINSINAKSADGDYLFSDSERRAMANDFDKQSIKAFKVAFDNAPEEQQEAFYKKIMEDGSFVVQSDKGPVNINAKQVLTPTMYTDVKNYVRDAYYKQVANKEKEKKYQQVIDIAEFGKNPTKTALEEIKAKYPDLDTKKLESLEEKYASGPNYLAETQPEAMTGAIDLINSIATEETYMPDGRPNYAAMFDKFVEVNDYINRNSTGKDAQLGYDDVQALREKAAQVMIDEEEKVTRMEIAKDTKSFLSSINWAFGTGNEMAAQGFAMAEGKIDDPQRVNTPMVKMITRNTIQLAEAALADKSIPREERVRKAKEIYKVGKEQLIRARNPEIGDKKVDDKYTLNGVTYEIVSFDNYDVQLRIVK